MLIVIGAGPAAMAAAVSAYDNGVRDILVLERDTKTGGILNQCIHNGFGLHYFKEELTGPEYAERFSQEMKKRNIRLMLDTMVLDITENKIVTAINKEEGLMILKADAIILAMGCRERTRGALNIAGTRPSGIFSAGSAQLFVNIHGMMPGKEVVVLGSGDIGLIMARRMTLEGAKVHAVCELLPYSGGLNRNIVQCLNDFDIPLKLSHTVVQIHGEERLTGVTIAKVDKNFKPIPETFEYIPCDTLLLSVGLIPENELSLKANIAIDNITSGPIVNESMQTSVEGIFACGNVVHVHDLVDFVTLESERAGKSAAQYILCEKSEQNYIQTKAKNGIRYIVPHKINLNSYLEEIPFFFRTDNIYRNVEILVKSGRDIIKKIKKKHVAPGEMENINIDKKLLKSDSEITIELSEV